jgi:ribosome-binding protein aMBF1 (putative translation factor)
LGARKLLLALLGFAHRQIKAKRLMEDPPKLNRKRFGTTPKTLGEWVRYWRTAAGFDQRQLAQAAGIARRRIQMVEADGIDCRADEIKAIERAIGIDAAILTARGQQ